MQGTLAFLHILASWRDEFVPSMKSENFLQGLGVIGFKTFEMLLIQHPGFTTKD